MRKILSFGLIIALLTTIIQVSTPPKAQAAYYGDYIISNSVFLDAKSMSANQIQSFLNDRGSGLASRSYKLQCYGSDSRERQWYTAIGAPCDQNISAARIIYYASQIYGMNPRVILATLQKEQGLVTAGNPTSWQLDQAMGYACPTSGGCGASNFSYQIDAGTWALRYHYERANRNYNWWSPSSNNYWVCGSSKNYYKPSLYPNQNVRFYDGDNIHYRTYNIKNAATSAMYCYTPHAYNNFPGCKPAYGVSYTSWRQVHGSKGMCYSGSYNFVTAFETWFGPTANRYVPLTNPRWMETNTQVYKINPHTEENVDSPLPKGTELRFVDKILVKGQWYLRTEYDKTHGYEKGVPLSGLTELNLDYIPQSPTTWMELKSSTAKVLPASNQSTGANLSAGTQLFITSRVQVGGKWYLRSEYDTTHNIDTVLPEDSLTEINLSYEPLSRPRQFRASKATHVVNPRTRQNISSLSTNSDINYTTKVFVGGQWYLRSSSDTSNNLERGVLLAHLTESPVNFEPLDTPRWMRVRLDTPKLHPTSGAAFGTIGKNTLLFMNSRYSYGGKWYLRSEYDTAHSLDKAIPEDNLASPIYVSLDTPRFISLKNSTTKTNPITRQDLSADQLTQGMRIRFTTKILLDGKWYLRSESDTINNRDKTVALQHLNI